MPIWPCMQPKRLGAATTSFFSQNLPNTGNRRQLNAQQFRRAFTTGELFIEYQPRYTLGDEQMLGLQALPCWQHPDMGLLLPEAFVAASQECDMLGPLADWLFGRLAEDIHRWHDQGKQVLPVSLPCSSRMMLDAGFLSMIERWWQQYDLRPGLLTLELRERVVTEATSQLLECLQRLNAWGLGLAIGAFGSGRSLFLKMQSVSVRAVVLDREIIDEIPHDEESSQLVAALVPFCHAFEVRVVADGGRAAGPAPLPRGGRLRSGPGELFLRPPWSCRDRQSPAASLKRAVDACYPLW